MGAGCGSGDDGAPVATVFVFECLFSGGLVGCAAAAVLPLVAGCRSGTVVVLAVVGCLSCSGGGATGLAGTLLTVSLCRLRFSCRSCFSGAGTAAIAACASSLEGGFGTAEPVLPISLWRERVSAGGGGGKAVADLASPGSAFRSADEIVVSIGPGFASLGSAR